MGYIIKDRNLLLLFLVSFLFFCSETILLPVLPMVLAKLDYSHTQIGMTLGAFALGVLVFRPLTAHVTDKKSRKLSLIIGTFIFLVAPFLYFVSLDFTYLMGVRFFHGLGISFFTTACPAYVADLAPAERRGEILGHMGVPSSLATVVGPLAGVLIYDMGGIHMVLWGCVILGLLGFVLTLIIAEDKKTGEEGGDVTSHARIFTNRSVVVASALGLVLALMNGGVFTFLPVLVKGEFSVNVGLVFMINSLSLVFFRFLASPVSDRYGRGPAVFYSFLILCLSYHLIGSSRTTAGLIGAAVLNGIGVGGCMPALIALVVDHVDEKARGLAFSVFYGAYDIGMILGGAALGVLADYTSLREMYTITAMLAVFAVLGFALVIRPGAMESLKWTLLGRGSRGDAGLDRSHVG